MRNRARSQNRVGLSFLYYYDFKKLTRLTTMLPFGNLCDESWLLSKRVGVGGFNADSISNHSTSYFDKDDVFKQEKSWLNRITGKSLTLSKLDNLDISQVQWLKNKLLLFCVLREWNKVDVLNTISNSGCMIGAFQSCVFYKKFFLCASFLECIYMYIYDFS